MPKLELSAASILAKFMGKISKALDLTIVNLAYWTDSQTVLACIKLNRIV